MQFSSRSIKFVIAGLVMACAGAVSHAATVRFSLDSKTGQAQQDAADASLLCPGVAGFFCRNSVTADVDGLVQSGKKFPSRTYTPPPGPKDGLHAGWNNGEQRIDLRSGSGDLLQLSFRVLDASIAYGFSGEPGNSIPGKPDLAPVGVPTWLIGCGTAYDTKITSGAKHDVNVRMTYGSVDAGGADHSCSVIHNVYEDRYNDGKDFYGDAWGVALGLGNISADLSTVPSGTYTGTYDFGLDFGLGVQSASLHFEVIVKHEIKVGTLPPSVTLQPPRGWGSWSSARPPPKVEALLSFTLEANTGIKVYLDCITGMVGEHCLLEKMGVGIPSTVPVQAFLSSFYFTENSSGSGGPVEKMPLKTNQADAVRIVPRGGTLNRASLDLLVDQTGVNEMMGYPGSHYQGTINVIFEWAPAP